MKTNLCLSVFILFLCFLSCDDEDNNDDDNGFQTEIVTDPVLFKEILNTTNLNTNAFPWFIPDENAGRPCSYTEITNGISKRWDFENDGLIPVKLNGFTMGEEALDQIEQELGLTLFDRNSLANTPNEQILKGIIFSEGTASGPNPSTDCGHVSRGIGTFAYPTDITQEFFDIDFEYDAEGNIIGYDNSIIGEALDDNDTVIGRVLENTRFVFNDNNRVVGYLSNQNELIFDKQGIAICNTFGSPNIYNQDGIAIGGRVFENDPNQRQGIFVEGPEGFQSIFGSSNDYSNVFYNNFGRMDTVLYVHIGSTQCQNEIRLDLVIHEVGHALGLGGHFQGFGFGPAIDGNFWNILNSLYKSPIGSNENEIEFKQIKF